MKNKIVGQLASFQSGFTVIVVDDDSYVRDLMKRAFAEECIKLLVFEDLEEALAFLRRGTADLLFIHISDLRFGGLDELTAVRLEEPDASVVVMSSSAAIEDAVSSMRNGAADFLPKPFSTKRMLKIFRRIERLKSPRKEIMKSGRPVFRDEEGHCLISHSPQMHKALQLVDRIAPLPTTVLIEGESGSGKELIARQVHERSERSGKPFVAFNSVVLPDHLMESELFGYEKGAFTGAEERKIGYFEAASEGTIFIDEVAEMSPDLQTKLLRVIQERTFRRIGGIQEIRTDARIITATNRDLRRMVAEGRFRKDLYYRVNVVKIKTPPLRERPEDIPLLAQFFVVRYAKRFSKRVIGFDSEVAQALLAHPWDGNVRELQNVIERAVAISDGREISISDLPADFFGPVPKSALLREITPFRVAKSGFELEYLTVAMQKADGNVSLASRLTGISRQHFYQKLARLGIDQSTFRSDEAGLVV